MDPSGPSTLTLFAGNMIYLHGAMLMQFIVAPLRWHVTATPELSIPMEVPNVGHVLFLNVGLMRT